MNKKEKKVSKIQQRALEKINNEWHSAYYLQENINTLFALVKKGLVEHKCLIGSEFSPRTNIMFRLNKK